MMLSVEAIEAGYGGARVLKGVDFELDRGEALALIGRNGMGKTTTVRALFGLLPLKAGRIVFEGSALNGRPPYAIARADLALRPRGAKRSPRLPSRRTSSPPPRRAGAAAAGRLPRRSGSSRASPSAAATPPTSSPAESNRCSPSAAR